MIRIFFFLTTLTLFLSSCASNIQTLLPKQTDIKRITKKEKIKIKTPVRISTKQNLEYSPPHDIILPIPKKSIEETPKTQLPENLTENGFRFDVPINRSSRVDRWIYFFTSPKFRNRFKLWMERSGRYIPLFKRILKENKIPEDLAYLVLIESGFNLRARSRAGAVGPWQFMPATGRRFGLRINYYLDERRDPIKSTKAAAKYLKKLYEQFQDWHLALAAYNAGENRIQRILRKTRKTTYWEIIRTRYVPKETKQYVSKYIAGLILAKYPKVFGFVNLNYHLPLETESVILPRGINLRLVSRLSKMSIKDIRKYNPQLRRWQTPPGRGHTIQLPKWKARIFISRLSKLPKRTYIHSGKYRIQPGDTFSSIAIRLKIPISTLMEFNPNVAPKLLKVGKYIQLPKLKKTKRKIDKKYLESRETTHLVKRGETISGIAKKYKTTTYNILKTNDIERANLIFVGDILIIKKIPKLTKSKIKKKQFKPKNKVKKHRVKKGENLSRIAKKYRIKVKTLIQINKKLSSGIIYPGDIIIIRK